MQPDAITQYDRQTQTLRQSRLITITDILLQLMTCVQVEAIGGAKQYYPTMRKALKVGAERAATWGEWLEQARLLLKIPTLSKEVASSLYSAGETIELRGEWPELRQLMMEEATLIEVRFRHAKEQRKTLSARTYTLRAMDASDEEE